MLLQLDMSGWRHRYGFAATTKLLCHIRQMDAAEARTTLQDRLPQAEQSCAEMRRQEATKLPSSSHGTYPYRRFRILKCQGRTFCRQNMLGVDC